MNFVTGITVIIGTTVMFFWPFVFLIPSWLAIKGTWPTRQTKPRFFAVSLIHLALVITINGWMYYREFSPTTQSEIKVPGIELVKDWLTLPLLSFPLSVLGYFLIKKFADKREAWKYDLIATLKNSVSTGNDH